MGKITFVAGANELVIEKILTQGNYTSLKLNGHEVLHGENIEDALDGYDSGVLSIVTQDTATFDLSGRGTLSNKLSGRPIFPVASASPATVGIVQLNPDFTSESTDTAATVGAVNRLRERAYGYALKTITVNGQPLSGNVLLTPESFVLDQVDNTSDLGKPISTLQQEHLDQYGDLGHTHDFGALGLSLANYGIFGMASVISTDNFADSHGGATPATVYNVVTRYGDIIQDSDSKMVRDVMDVRYWACPNYLPIEDGFTIRFPATAQVYYNGLMRRLEESTLTIAQDGDMHDRHWNLYIYLGGETPTYRYSEQRIFGSWDYFHIGEVVTAADGIVSFIDEATELPVIWLAPPVSIGSFRELIEHVESESPHLSSGELSPEDISLDLINTDWLTYEYMTPGTPRAMRDKWSWVANKADAVISKAITNEGAFTLDLDDATVGLGAADVPVWNDDYHVDISDYHSELPTRACGIWFTIKSSQSVLAVLGRVNKADGYYSLVYDFANSLLGIIRDSDGVWVWSVSITGGSLHSAIRWTGAGTALGIHGGFTVSGDKFKSAWLGNGGIIVTNSDLANGHFTIKVVKNGQSTVTQNITYNNSLLRELFDSQALGYGLRETVVAFPNSAEVFNVGYDVSTEIDAYVSTGTYLDFEDKGPGLETVLVSATAGDVSTVPLIKGCTTYWFTYSVPSVAKIDGIDVQVMDAPAGNEYVHAIDIRKSRYEDGLRVIGRYKIETDGATAPLNRTWAMSYVLTGLKTFTR